MRKAPESKLVAPKSRIAGPSSRVSDVNARSIAAPQARRLVPPGGSRLAFPRTSRQDGLRLVVEPDHSANMPGARFDVGPTRANLTVQSQPGPKTETMTMVRNLNAPGIGTLSVGEGVCLESSAEGRRFSAVGASSLVGKDFRGESHGMKVQYTGSEVAGDEGFLRERIEMPEVLVSKQKSYGVRTSGAGRGTGVSRIAGASSGSGVQRLVAPGGASVPSGIGRGTRVPSGISRGPAVPSGVSKMAQPGSKGRGVAIPSGIGRGAAVPANVSRMTKPGSGSRVRVVETVVSRGPVVPPGAGKAATTRKIVAPASTRSAKPASAISGLKQPAPKSRSSTRPATTGQQPSDATRTSALKKPDKTKPKKESIIQRFDRQVNEELKRRHDPDNVLVEATTSDVNLLEAVDNLTRAEAMDRFAETVRIAEEAAASVPPDQAEAAAVAAAKDYQAKVTHVLTQEVPGNKPIQVVGYVGITKPKRPIR